MLQQIRDRLTGPTALIFLGLIAIPFVFVGVGAPLIGSGYAAKVDGTEISTPQFEFAWQSQVNQNPEILNYAPQFQSMLRRQVLDQLILEQLISNYLNDAGLQVGDRMVTDWVQQVPNFREDGKFSREKYRSELELQGREPAEFEASIYQSMRQLQLQQALTATAFVTPSEYRRYLNLFAEQRAVTIATFDFEAMMAEIDISDEEIQEFYESKPEEFFTNETVEVEFIEIRRDVLAENAVIDEDELLQYYEESGSRYLQDEQRRARHILIPFGDDEDAAHDEADALTARAKAGEPFEDLASQYSKDGMTASNGGDLGVILHSQMPDALGDSIFSMGAGEIRGPVRSDFGYHVVRLDEIIEGGPLPLAQVRGELERELRDREAEAEFRNLETDLGNALFDGLDFAAISQQTGLDVQTANEFTRSGGEPFGANQAVIDAVFDSRVLEDGEVSDIIEIDANRSAMFRVAQHNQAVRKELAEVQEQIRGALKSARAQERIADRSDELQAQLRQGADIATAAAEMGATVSGPQLLARAGSDADARLVSAVFRAGKPVDGQPKVGFAVTQTGDYAVFSLSNVIPGRPEAIPLADRDARKQELAEASGTADFSAFINELFERAEIVRSEDLLETPDAF